jgi:hypothetical protein
MERKWLRSRLADVLCPRECSVTALTAQGLNICPAVADGSWGSPERYRAGSAAVSRLNINPRDCFSAYNFRRWFRKASLESIDR